MKDYLIELAKLSGKCLVVFIFAFLFFLTEPTIHIKNDQWGRWSIKTSNY